MPRQTQGIAEELNERLRRSGPCVTMLWEDFYTLCDRERLKQPFLDDVQEQALSRYQLIVAYGSNTVVVCYDQNFAPER